jgi:hypothetical protein
VLVVAFATIKSVIKDCDSPCHEGDTMKHKFCWSKGSRVALAVASLNGLVLAPVAHAQTEATNGTWAFTPPRDQFSPNALLDLRYLNEKVAGQSGFVRRSADGNDFVLGNGQPARFWSILSFHKNEENPEWSHHARWLAKRGVNLVRLFGDLFQMRTPSSPIFVSVSAITYGVLLPLSKRRHLYQLHAVLVARCQQQAPQIVGHTR